MKIKDLPSNESLEGVKFKHPKTGEMCIWRSQWGYPNGKAGVWYKTDENSTQIYPLCLDKLEEALEFDVVESTTHDPKESVLAYE